MLMLIGGFHHNHNYLLSGTLLWLVFERAGGVYNTILSTAATTILKTYHQSSCKSVEHPLSLRLPGTGLPVTLSEKTTALS